jgi:predicted nuclease with TOPRIM domain
MLQEKHEEIKQLRQTIAKLEAENARLIAKHERELDARRAELLDLKEAYDQFEQESDLLMNELEQKYERLRSRSRYQNPRSML